MDEELKKSEEQLVIKQQALAKCRKIRRRNAFGIHQAAYQSLLQNYEKSVRQIDAQKSRCRNGTLESLSIQELLKEEPEIESGYPRNYRKFGKELSNGHKKRWKYYLIDGERKEITG